MESIGIGATALRSARPILGVLPQREPRIAGSVVDRRLEELKRIRKGLFQLVEHCPGHGSPDDCPIIQTLSGGAS